MLAAAAFRINSAEALTTTNYKSMTSARSRSHLRRLDASGTATCRNDAAPETTESTGRCRARGASRNDGVHDDRTGVPTLGGLMHDDHLEPSIGLRLTNGRVPPRGRVRRTRGRRARADRDRTRGARARAMVRDRGPRADALRARRRSASTAALLSATTEGRERPLTEADTIAREDLACGSLRTRTRRRASRCVFARAPPTPETRGTRRDARGTRCPYASRRDDWQVA